jgi:exodeoxyribonuclease-3
MRLHQLQAIIENHAPAVIGLQETKAQDKDFPEADINALGYEVVYHGQKTHYGVALMTNLPIVKTQKGFDGDDEATQRRFIAIQCELKDGSLCWY